MDEQKQLDKLEPSYNSPVPTNTGCSLEDLPEATADREGSERGSGRSVLVAWHDDDVDDEA